MADGDAQAAWAWLLMASLADAGVSDVIISPGSRSTPLVLAAHGLAAHGLAKDGPAADGSGEPGLRCHDVIDERTAGFYALGRAKATGRPVLLLCTSGSAAAHYLPALLEARQSFVPLLVLTADRPVELAQCGANQTIDQVKLFGDQVVAFFDLGAVDTRPAGLRAVRRVAAQAVARSLGPVPGGVHLNMRLRKPLEPDGSDPPAKERAEAARARDACVGERPPATLTASAVERIAELLRTADRPLVVAGPAAMAQVADRASVESLLAATGAPLLAEATSQWRFRPPEEPATRVDFLDLVLDGFKEAQPADLLVQVGAEPTSGAWKRYRDRAVSDGCQHVVVAEHGWPDAGSSATLMMHAAAGPTLAALAKRVDASRAAVATWTRRWLDADRRARTVVASLLAGAAASGPRTEPLSEAVAVHRAATSVPAGGVLALGNSLPVRLVDAFVAGDAVDPAVRVWHQRGTSGIDGLLSGAAGAADALGAPTLLLVGDVSLVHDLGGLALAARLRVPFVILVLENGGGRIFDLLPVARHPGAMGALDHWRTPHHTRFDHAAAAFGVPYLCAEARATLESALAEAWSRPGATLVEAVVPPGGAAVELERVKNAFAEAG